MSRRLTEEDWLAHGLEVLSKSGFTALKAEPLAKSLGVSRGSFYWHFKDIKDYHEKLLGLWRARFTQNIITDVETGDDPAGKLTRLMGLAYQPQNGLENALRNWAQHSKDVRALIDEVDVMRLAYVTNILTDAGLPPDLAAPRAKFIYAAAIGVTLIGKQESDTLSFENIENLARIMLS